MRLRSRLRPAHERRQSPAQKIQCPVEDRIITANLNFQTGIGHRRAISAEHHPDFGQRHAADDMREIHRNLPRGCDVSYPTRTPPKRPGFDSKHIGNDKVDRESRLMMALRLGRVAEIGAARPRFQRQRMIGLQHLSTRRNLDCRFLRPPLRCHRLGSNDALKPAVSVVPRTIGRPREAGISFFADVFIHPTANMAAQNDPASAGPTARLRAHRFDTKRREPGVTRPSPAAANRGPKTGPPRNNASTIERNDYCYRAAGQSRVDLRHWS